MNEHWVVYGIRLKGSWEYRYVGITTQTLEARMNQHKYRSANKFPCDIWIKKHLNNIEVDILEVENNKSQEMLWFLERKWIATLKESGHRLLNLTIGGDGAMGRKQTEETRQKIAESLRGIPHTQERRKKQSLAKVGKSQSTESNIKRSIAFSGEKNPFFGKKHSPESLEKIAKASHNRYHTTKQIKKVTCVFCKEEN